jgi:glucosamine-6-phosphate deaminase
MRVERFETAQDVARGAAELVRETVERTPEAVLLLPAGATPIPLYEELVRRAGDGSLDLSRAHIFQLDELVGVGPADERGFQCFLRRHLLDRMKRVSGRDHLLDGCSGDPRAEIARHGSELARLGGADLVLLGLGHNGHVAFNEPGSRLEDRARQTQLARPTLNGLAARFAPHEMPALGITLGLAEIHASKKIGILVTGKNKATILRRLTETPPTPDVPASLLIRHGDLVVLADGAACGA